MRLDSNTIELLRHVRDCPGAAISRHLWHKLKWLEQDGLIDYNINTGWTITDAGKRAIP